MSYDPVTDFLGLVRRVSNGARIAEVPGLDYVLAAFARAGMFLLSVGQTAPTTNQTTTVWLKPALQSWTAEGTVFLWNAASGTFEPATPALWAALFTASGSVVQDVEVAGPVNVLPNASIVRIMNVGAPVTLIMPLSTEKTGDVLISDWANLAGTNNVTIQRSGADVFPNGATSWVLAADGASLRFAPVPGGYVV